ncbi:MAG: polyvinyl alcohol dehydrogenase (cytochrome), partial [Candidatus Azotimanducaceae bacterium]
QQAGLHKADLENLELAWALAFPNITMMRSQPAVVGNTMFISPVESKKVYAFNIESQPCLQWVHSSDRVLRTSLTFGKRSDGKRVLVFGDMEASIHMLDAANGELLWRTDLKRFPESIITGTPQLVGDRVYASVSQFEIMIGHQSEHECCKASGAVAALNATNGDVVWLTPTLPEAKPVRDRGDGQMIWGPSGAPVWTSPAIDLKRGLLYVGTGEANSEPAHKHTDAILAIDLKSGEVQWSFQASANDIFLAGCWREESLNCPPEYSINRDVDFGASVIIAQRSDGSDVLLAGQKSSVVWALDPDDQGRVLWRWSYGQGTANGGIHWAMAIDDGKVYAPISDPGRPRPGFEPVPGLYALDIDSGDLVWQHRTYPDCDGREQKAPRCQFLYGFSAAPIVVDGAVVTGSLDGYLRIFDGDDGRLMFTYDTIREFQTVNGIKGQGGAIDSASLVAANGLLLVNSGYGMFGQPQGNVLLAFRPASKAKSHELMSVPKRQD